MATNRKAKSNLFRGIGVSPGIRMGKIFKLVHHKLETPMLMLAKEQIKPEMERFEEALAKTIKQIAKQKKGIDKAKGQDHFFILEAHELMLKDKMLSNQILDFIESHNFNAEWALKTVMERFESEFSKMDDAVYRKRLADLSDVGRRLLENLLEMQSLNLRQIPDDAILVARSMAPGDATHFYKKPIRALALETGGKASHIAIVARSMNIPAVMGVEGLLDALETGDEIIIDGSRGVAILNPTSEQSETYRKKQKKRNRLIQRLHEKRHEPAVTKDGRHVSVKANIETLDEIPTLENNGADGIGLFRTEFLFLDRPEPPSEEQQFEYYKHLAESCACGAVTIRTLDIGGDKTPAYWTRCDDKNPALGCRAVRSVIQNKSLFVDQVRAILRASAYGEIKMLLPFISGVAELESITNRIEEIKAALEKKEIPFDTSMKTGIMVEIPSAAIISDILAPMVDFFSIGTNDLIQYTIAVDRNSDQLSYLYNPLHPAILRLIHQTSQAAERAGIPAGLCGEMASEPIYTSLLLGLGVTELDMPASSIPFVKEIIRNTTMEEAKALAERALEAHTGIQAESIVYPEMMKRFPELISDDWV